MKQGKNRSTAKYWLLLCSVFIFVSCQSLPNPNPTDENGSEIQSVAGKSKCEKAVPHIATNREVTWMYHWTKSPLALSNPLEYVRKSVAAGAKDNQEGRNRAKAGAGLYLSSDPFSSVNYGEILVRVPIKANILVANWDNLPDVPDLEVYLKSGCKAIIYIFGGQSDSFSFGEDRALVLSSMDAIETRSEKISSFSRGDDESKSVSQQPETKIADLSMLFRRNRLTDVTGAARDAATFFEFPSKEEAQMIQVGRNFGLICDERRKKPDASMLNLSFQEFKKVPEFMQYLKGKSDLAAGLDLTGPDELVFWICNYIVDSVMFPSPGTEKNYPADQTKIYLAAWGIDIGTPPPATREAFAAEVAKIYFNLPEVRSKSKLVQFIFDYLKKEAPQSIDKWR